MMMPTSALLQHFPLPHSQWDTVQLAGSRPGKIGWYEDRGIGMGTLIGGGPAPSALCQVHHLPPLPVVLCCT